jgi:hypothetical protein
MHSLKQGNFFTTKKNGYQYLEKKSNSKLMEGFIEANTPPNTNWKMFENHMVKHETSVGSDFKYDSSNTDVTHNIPGYNNMTVQEQEEKDNEILNAADAVAPSADIYAIEILKNGKVLYYRKYNDKFPNEKIPTIYSQASSAKLFLRKNNGMTEAIPSTIVTDDAIMASLQDANAIKFNTQMSWYNTILNEYDTKLNEYYTKKEDAAKEVGKGSAYKGKVISWKDTDNKTKYAYVNNLGVYRNLEMDNGAIVGSSNGNVGGDTNPGENLIKSGCPINVTSIGESPSTLKLQGGVTTFTKWEGACYNPGLYIDKGSVNEFFVDHEGKVHKNPKSTGKCSDYTKIYVKDIYNNIENVSTTQDYNCEYDTVGNSDAELLNLENRVKELNGELKILAKGAGDQAGPTNLSQATQTLLEDKNMEQIDTSYAVQNGLLQLLQQIPGKDADDMGYRQILHALKNETSVKIPTKIGGVDSVRDISGILATQNELNMKMKELSSLGNNVASLESSMISKQEQIRAINLHFIAWGLAGITIGAIGLHTFFKK